MSSITRIRKNNYEKYFTINLAIHDLPADVLSTDGKSFHTYIASKPDGWEYNRNHAIKIIGSSYRVDKATAELKKLGLLTVLQVRENGRIVGYEWQIESDSEKIVLAHDNQEMDSTPDHDSPDLEYQDHDNHESLKELPKEEKLTLSEKLTPGARSPETIPLPFAEDKPAKPKRIPKPKDPLLPKHDPDGFKQVCAQHPGTVDQAKAARQWDKLKPSPELVSTILHYQAERKGSGDWATQDPAYICHLHTFLRDYGWLVKWVKPSATGSAGVINYKQAREEAERAKRIEEADYLRSFFQEA